MIVRIHKCRAKGFVPVAWIIMLLQCMNPFKSNSYNHMSLSYIGRTGNWKYADSTLLHGVMDEQPEEEFLDRYNVVYTKSIDLPCEEVQFKAWLEANRHKKYDIANLIGLTGKMLHIFKRNPWGADFRKMVCNELILSMITRFYGYEIGDPDNYDLLMTAELVESL